jgi:hypothetical protein
MARPASKPQTRSITLPIDRVSLALGIVFLFAAAFYLWTAGTTSPLALHGGEADRYNQLASAFLHLHLSIGPAPTALLRLPDPYAPAQNAAFLSGINDDALYGGHLYFIWGPAPALVLLVPLHLLGFVPSSSLIVSFFAIVGLGFALATLRVLLRQIGNTTLWMCLLAAFTLVFSSMVPFIVRSPSVNQEAIIGGYCFTMAGFWLAISAMADRRASLGRLALMSLCFGLAAGSRPTLGLAALVLIPVYMSLRSTRPRHQLLMTLATPVGGCFLLLLAYNQARFGQPLEFGTQYQLAGYNPFFVHFAEPSYVPPGAWYYLLSPPRPAILFPFIHFGPPPYSYPVEPPANYLNPEPTSGLLPMAPIVIFLAALPWIWRRRPTLLGPLALPLLILAGAGIAAMLFVSYEFFATTERYEVDFATPFLLGALAAWLALSNHTRGRRRRLIRTSGALLATWGCLTGLAISFTGPNNLLAITHPGTWSTLENIGSPLSAAIAAVTGGPVLAEVSAANVLQGVPASYTRLTAEITAFWLNAGERANLTIVSPNTRTAALVGDIIPGPELSSDATLQARIRGPGHMRYTYQLPTRRGPARIPVRLTLGVNHITLEPLASKMSQTNPTNPATQGLLAITNLSLADHY